VVAEDESAVPLAFTVSDAEMPAGELALSASASNERLLPAGGVLLGGSGSSRTLTLTPAPNETGVATVRVTADSGVFHATETIRLTVTPVGNDGLRGVALTAPRGAATNAEAVVVAAAADDPDGALQHIEYVADGKVIASSASWPYAVAWTNLAHGPHTLVAVACDAQGQRATSAPVAFTNYLPELTAALIPGGASWRYFDGTNDLGTAWRNAHYDDTTWGSGPAMLGFGDANGLLPTTTVANNRQWTTYFRKTFVVPAPDFVAALTARLLRDDGAAVYLNGVEVWRDNLPAGVMITNATPAGSSIGGAAERAWLTNSLSRNLLVPGTNLLAVELHQQSLSSTDVSFDFALDGAAVLPEAPALGIEAAGAATRIAWASADPGVFELCMATTLAPPVTWLRLSHVPVWSGFAWSVTLPSGTNGCAFFRLMAR
jgi:hypothetical protein